ncbi:flotillin domain-containing protein [Bernardetia sp.]|uniref:flotillin family protein n=1 Tax=Bernardetia sp. TaxID=1937974 RepID=UPI0025BD2280|nr:flotillin domain-containing protein [Bernardetia sp.]
MEAIILQSSASNGIPAFVFVAAGIILFLVFLVALLRAFLKKASPGTALVKTGFGLQKASVSTSSAIVIPLLHKIETIDLTVKTVRIRRREHESLSCKDGIRAEVEVDFYIKINSMDEDIRRVASAVGCNRASDIGIIRELFEAKFSDALKTAGSKLTFDSLYQNRTEFKEQIMKALGQDEDSDVILNGYRLDDVAIQYLEQLPLSQHDDQNVLDSQGIKEIAQRTASQAEAANLRLREKEVRIAEQDQAAQTRQLEITQDLEFKSEKQKREIAEAQSRERALAEKTKQEQESIEQQALIARELAISLANQKKEQESVVAEKAKEQAVSVADENKVKEIELARIRRESEVAEQLREKLKMLEETAKQEAEKIKAEEQAKTVQAVEVANRDKEIEVIKAKQEAETQLTNQRVEADIKAYNLIKNAQSKQEAAELDLKTADKQAQIEVIEADKEAKKELIAFNVDVDAEAYRLRTVAQAKLEAAELESKAAELQAQTIRQIGEAEADALLAKIEAQNKVGKNLILADAIKELIPLLPTIMEKLMAPAEKIDSIKFLNINGMQNGMGTSPNGAANGNVFGGASSPMQNIMGTVMGVGMAVPMLKEVVKTIKSDNDYGDVLEMVTSIPGGEKLLSFIENFNEAEKAKEEAQKEEKKDDNISDVEYL